MTISKGSRAKVLSDWLRKPTPFKAGCLWVLLACLLYSSFGSEKPALLQALDNQLTGAMFRWRGAQPTTDAVVIVDIDEKSLARVGQWPWPRDTVAALVDKINRQRPLAIGLDIMFIEPDRTSPGRFLDGLQPLFQVFPGGGDVLRRMAEQLLLDHDQLLGAALAKAPSVLGYAMVTGDDGLKDPASVPFPSATLQLDPPAAGFDQLDLIPAYRAVINLPAVAQGMSEGFLNFFPESSGAVHKVPLMIELDGIPYPSMALETARIGLGQAALTIHAAPPAADGRRGLLGVSLGERFLPTDDQGQMSLNFRGGYRSFPYLSAVDLLEDRSTLPLAGKYVLIGTSAAGLLDLQTTPLASIFPGVEIHANVIDNILSGDPLRYDVFTEIGITFCLIVGGGLLLSLLLAWAGPLLGAAGAVLLVFVTVAGNYRFLFLGGSLVGLTFPLATILSVWLVVTLANYLLVDREKRFVQGAFRHYLAPQVVEQLIRQPERLSLAGEEKELSVLFCDIRNFTTISEGMDSVALAAFMNRYLTAMSQVITEGRGMIDKFIGDAIMAIWGAPLDDPEHPLQAVTSALNMQQSLVQLRRLWAAEGLAEIHIGIGINTGPMRVGNFGSRELFDYTVIGDQVNLASRLEGLTKNYGAGILITERTRDAVAGRIWCRSVDLVRVKGKAQPVQIFEPVGFGAAADAETRQWEEALLFYRQRRFAEAAGRLEQLHDESPRLLYRVYLDRIQQFQQSPPPADWDGVFTHHRK